MQPRLAELARRIALSSISTLLATAPGASATEPPTVDGDEYDRYVREQAGQQISSQLVLQQMVADATRYTSHRSHRSHSSHQSHYSSRTATPPRARPTPAPNPTPAQTPAVIGDTLGARVLRLGMKGPDVNALMLLLVRYKYLAPEDLNTDQAFTAPVEAAVRKFQTERKMEPDGVVGPLMTLYLKQLGGGR